MSASLKSEAPSLSKKCPNRSEIVTGLGHCENSRIANKGFRAPSKVSQMSHIISRFNFQRSPVFGMQSRFGILSWRHGCNKILFAVHQPGYVRLPAFNTGSYPRKLRFGTFLIIDYNALVGELGSSGSLTNTEKGGNDDGTKCSVGVPQVALAGF